MQRVIPAVSEDYEYTTPTVEYINAEATTNVENAATQNTATYVPPSNSVQEAATNGMQTRGGANIGTLDSLDLITLVEMFVTYAFIIAGALAALFIFIGGISFILSGGNDEKIKQAVNTIRYSIIGLIVTILSFTFVTIVGRIFQLDFMSYLSYAKIRDSITTVLTPVNQNDNSTFEIQN